MAFSVLVLALEQLKLAPNTLKLGNRFMTKNQYTNCNLIHFGALHPAASASAILQNHLSPCAVLIFVRTYQGEDGV